MDDSNRKNHSFPKIAYTWPQPREMKGLGVKLPSRLTLAYDIWLKLFWPDPSVSCVRVEGTKGFLGHFFDEFLHSSRSHLVAIRLPAQTAEFPDATFLATFCRHLVVSVSIQTSCHIGLSLTIQNPPRSQRHLRSFWEVMRCNWFTEMPPKGLLWRSKPNNAIGGKVVQMFAQSAARGRNEINGKFASQQRKSDLGDKKTVRETYGERAFRESHLKASGTAQKPICSALKGFFA